MPLLTVYVDDDTLARLERASADTGRKIEELAECAVSEAALNAHPDVKEVPKTRNPA